MIKNIQDEVFDADEYEVPSEVSEIEAIIYDYIVDKYGTREAEDPSWNIQGIAASIVEHKDKGTLYKLKNMVKYKL